MRLSLKKLSTLLASWPKRMALRIAWNLFAAIHGESRGASGELNFRIERAGTAHGLCLWFDAQLLEGICYSSGPDGATVYGQTLLPWPEPVAVRQGQELHVHLAADLIGSDYVWRW